MVSLDAVGSQAFMILNVRVFSNARFFFGMLIYKYIHTYALNGAGGHVIGGEGHTPRASAVLVFTVQEI